MYLSSNSLQIFQTHLIERAYESFEPQMKLFAFTESTHRWITNLACIGGIDRCLDAARNAFSSAVHTNATVRPEEMHTVYCFGLRNATQEEFSWLLNRLRTTRDAKEQEILLAVFIVCTDQVDRMRRAIINIQEYLSEEGNRLKDFSLEFNDSYLRVVEEKFEQLFKILDEDSELMKNLGYSLAKEVLLAMKLISSTKDENAKLVQLVKKFNEIFENENDRLNLEIRERKPKLNSLVLEDFLQKYVSKLNAPLQK